MTHQDFESGIQRWGEMVDLIQQENPTWSMAQVVQRAYAQSMLLYGEVYCPMSVMRESLNR